MCARAYKTYTDTWPHINSVNAPYCTHWGQINSSTWIMFDQQIPYLIYCFAVWHIWVQGVSWNLPLASNPFSIFFSSYLSSLSLARYPPFSFQCLLLPLTPISLFFFCSCCLSFTDGMTCGDGGYAKHSSNECRGCHNENGIKGMHTKTLFTFLWYGNLPAEAEKYI